MYNAVNQPIGLQRCTHRAPPIPALFASTVSPSVLMSTIRTRVAQVQLDAPFGQQILRMALWPARPGWRSANVTSYVTPARSCRSAQPRPPSVRASPATATDVDGARSEMVGTPATLTSDPSVPGGRHSRGHNPLWRSGFVLVVWTFLPGTAEMCHTVVRKNRCGRHAVDVSSVIALGQDLRRYVCGATRRAHRVHPCHLRP